MAKYLDSTGITTLWNKIKGTFLSLGGGVLSGELDVNNVLKICEPNDPLTGRIHTKLLCYSSSPYGIVFRGYASGTHSIQVQRESNDSEQFNLSLQPLGGNVIIGTTSSSSYKLHVNGSANATTLYENGNRVITTANIGSQSVSNADTVDNRHATYFWNYKTPSKSSGSWDVNEVLGDTIAAWAYGFSDSTSVIHGPIGDKVSDARAYYTLGGVYCPLQLSWYYTNSASLYARTYYNGTWYSWKKIAFTEDIPSTIAWSNVTNKPSTFTPATHNHDSTYLKLSGGTLSSSGNTVLILNTSSSAPSIAFSIGDTPVAGICTYSDGKLRRRDGSWAHEWLIYDTETLTSDVIINKLGYTPVSYTTATSLTFSSPDWTTITFNRDNVGSGSVGGIDGQGLYFKHQDTGGNSTYMYLKAGSGLKIDGKKVWYESNDGAGSGLDADLLDGKELMTKVTDWNTDSLAIFKSSENSVSNAPTTDFTYGVTLRFHRDTSTYHTDLVTSLYNDRLFFRRKTEGGYQTWRELIHSGNWSSFISVSSIGAASSGHSHDSVYARLGSPNNLVHAGNEITMIPGEYSGGVWFNYRTASGGTDGNISTYNMGNGKGGYTSVTASGFKVSGGNSNQALTADGGVYSLDNVLHGNSYGTMQGVISDCNSVDRTGVYSSSGFSNRPSGVSNWGTLFNLRLYNTNNSYHRQLFFDCYDSDKIWTRSDSGGSWTDWSEIITSKNIASQSVNYASSAGSATDSTKLPLSGGTMSGKIIASTTGTTTYDGAIEVRSVSGVTSSGWSTSRFNAPRIVFHWASWTVASLGYAGDFYRIVSDSTYYKIWDSGNDGSGSGLDADLLDGYHYSDIIKTNGRNLIHEYDVETSTSSYMAWSTHVMTERVEPGDQLTMTVEYSLPTTNATKTWVSAYSGGGYASFASFTATPGLSHHIESRTFNMSYESGHDDNGICIYYGPSDKTGTMTVHRVKIERGNRFTGWSSAPEDNLLVYRTLSNSEIDTIIV